MHPQSTTSRQQFVALCACGCGQPTRLAPYSDKEKGWTRNQPLQFLSHHHTRNKFNRRWNGGRYQTAQGYVWVKQPGHPLADSRGYVAEHRLVAEAMLGRPLCDDEIVHHRDHNTSNNAPDNLEVLTRSEHPHRHAGLRWSRSHDTCVDCGTAERQHEAYGRCKTCYQRWRYQQDADYRERKLASQRRPLSQAGVAI